MQNAQHDVIGIASRLAAMSHAIADLLDEIEDGPAKANLEAVQGHIWKAQEKATHAEYFLTYSEADIERHRVLEDSENEAHDGL